MPFPGIEFCHGAEIWFSEKEDNLKKLSSWPQFNRQSGAGVVGESPWRIRGRGFESLLLSSFLITQPPWSV